MQFLQTNDIKYVTLCKAPGHWMPDAGQGPRAHGRDCGSGWGRMFMGSEGMMSVILGAAVILVAVILGTASFILSD